MFLGLGSNLGDREQTILKAYKEIERLIGIVKCQSAFYYSEPWGFESVNGFVNTVILVETELSPQEVLKQTQKIERLLGKRKIHATERNYPPFTLHHPPSSILHPPSTIYHDRPIDIDILLYDDLTVDEPNLKIPHPLMHERSFVMEPLKELKAACPSVTSVQHNTDNNINKLQ